MLSAALGLAGSAIGAFGASKRQANELEMRQRELEAMKEAQGFTRLLAIQGDRERKDQNEYLREIEQLNRLLSEQERQFQIEQMYRNQGILSEERQFQVDRQLEMDREAARMQVMQLEQLLRNQNIAEEERRFAEQQLAQAQSVAAGEREEDLRRYYEEQALAEAQRDFMLSQFDDARTAMADDRAMDMANYDRVSNQINDMQRAIRMTELELGAVPELPRLTQADLDAEIARRQDQYMSDVDRAADRVASTNEANLIRAGIDSATPGNAARADITRQIADQYQSARSRAYDDALKYITGEQDFLMAGHGGEMDRRQAILAERAGIDATGLDALMRMPNVRSMTGAFDMAQAVPSGIYTRNIASAGNYQSPVQMGTSKHSGDIGLGLSNYQVGLSNADQSYLNLKSGIYNPANITLNDIGGLLGSSNNMQSTMFDAQNQRSVAADQAASQAWGNFGSNLSGFIDDHGGDIADAADLLFGSWAIG